jgi:hypothetical protein
MFIIYVMVFLCDKILGWSKRGGLQNENKNPFFE